MRGFLFAILSAALCGAALCVPVRLVLSGAIEPGSGQLCLSVRWLLYHTKIWFDLCLLDPPFMTVLIRHGRAVTVRPLLGGNKGEKPKFTESLRRALKVRRLQLGWAFGIREEPAWTAILGGGIEQATGFAIRMYLPETAEKLQLRLYPYFDRDLLHLSVQGIAIAFPVQIMRVWLDSKKKMKSGR